MQANISTQDMIKHANRWGIGLIGVTDAQPIKTKTYLFSKYEKPYRCGQGVATEIEPDLFDPRQIMDDAQSVIILGTYTYGVDRIVPSTPGHPRGKIGPWTRLYHFMSGQMADVVTEYLQSNGYSAVYTNDLPYRTIAANAGIGEIGRNHFLRAKGYGSYIRMSCVVTNAQLATTMVPYDFAVNRCGSCRACIDGCPTRAMKEDGALDNDICLHRLLQGSGDAKENGIPRQYWDKTEGYLMRTGKCLEICPHNRNLIPRDSIPRYIKHFPDFNKPDSPELIPLVMADDAEMEWLLPVAVYKYGKNHIRQNAIMALGQHRDEAAVSVLRECLLAQPHPLNAQMAAWALGMIGGDMARKALEEAQASPLLPEVLEEVRLALERWCA